jgi:hypothetical protein
MAEFVANGAQVGGASVSSLEVTLPECESDDTLFVAAFGQASNDDEFTIPSWTVVHSEPLGPTRAVTLLRKRATEEDSEATVTVSRATTAGEMHAVAFAFRGINVVTPLDPTGVVRLTASSALDHVRSVNYNPTTLTAHLCHLAIYYIDQTDFTTPPTSADATFTTHFSLEDDAGTGCSFALCSAPLSDGDTVAIGNWSSNSTTDAFSSGLTFALDTSEFVGFDGGDGVLTDAAGPIAGQFSNGGGGVLTEVA